MWQIRFIASQTSALIWRAVSVATTDVLTFFLSFRIQQKRCKHSVGKLTKQGSQRNTVLCLCSVQCTVCCRFWPQPKLWRRSTAAGCSVTFRPLQSKQSMSFTQKATVDTPGGGCECVCLFCYLVFSYGQLPAEGRSSRQGGWVAWISLFALDGRQKSPLFFSHGDYKWREVRQKEGGSETGCRTDREVEDRKIKSDKEDRGRHEERLE